MKKRKFRLSYDVEIPHDLAKDIYPQLLLDAQNGIESTWYWKSPDLKAKSVFVSVAEVTPLENLK